MKQAEIQNKIRKQVRNELDALLVEQYFFILNESKQVILLEAGFLDKIAQAVKGTKEWVTGKVKEFVNSEIVKKFTDAMSQITKKVTTEFKELVKVFQKVNPIAHPVEFIKALIAMVGRNPQPFNAEKVFLDKESPKAQQKIQARQQKKQVTTQTQQSESISYDEDMLFEFYMSMGYSLNNFMPKNGKLINETIEEGWDSAISLGTHGVSALAKILEHLALKSNNKEFANTIHNLNKKVNPEHALENIAKLTGDKGDEFIDKALEENNVPKVVNPEKTDTFIKILQGIVFIGLFAISLLAISHAGGALFVVEAVAMAVTSPSTFKDMIKIFSIFDATAPLAKGLQTIQSTFGQFINKAKEEIQNIGQNGNTGTPQPQSA